MCSTVQNPTEHFGGVHLYPSSHHKGSITGFLADGEILEDVISEDSNYLETFGITHDQLADALEYNSYVTNKEFTRTSTFYMGTQECPFGCDVSTGEDIDITRVSDGKHLKCSGLMPHLIRDHHFFEGNVPYRVSPISIINFFNMTPESDYGLKLEQRRLKKFIMKEKDYLRDEESGDIIFTVPGGNINILRISGASCGRPVI